MRKLRLAFGGVVVVSAVAFWVGCGSSSDDSLINAGNDGGSEASTTPPPPPPPPNPPPPPPSDAGDAGTLPDGAIAADGGTNIQDAGPGGDTTSLPCGAATCAIPSQSCCVANTNGGRNYLCVVGPATNCPVPDAGGQPEVVALKCSSSANCAATEQCCANVGAGGIAQSSCVPWGTCGSADAGAGNEHAVFCTLDAGNVGCDAGVTCVQNNDWGLPKNFGTCGNANGPF